MPLSIGIGLAITIPQGKGTGNINPTKDILDRFSNVIVSRTDNDILTR